MLNWTKYLQSRNGRLLDGSDTFLYDPFSDAFSWQNLFAKAVAENGGATPDQNSPTATDVDAPSAVASSSESLAGSTSTISASLAGGSTLSATAINIGTDYNVNGYHWDHAYITWSFASFNYGYQNGNNFSNSIASDSYFIQDVRAAINQWDQASPYLTFVEVADSEAVDIRFGYGNLDGVGNKLADTVRIPKSGNLFDHALVRFDFVDWITRSGMTADIYANSGSTLIPGMNVTLHEIGHALGLDHYDVATAIMNEYAGTLTTLTSHEINGINYIYGTSPGSGTPDFRPLITPFVDSTWAGGPANVNFTINNFGQVFYGNLEYKLYLSTDANIDPASDTFLGNGYYFNVGGSSNQPAFYAGEIKSGTFPINIPNGLAPGTYYVGLITDQGGYIAESNESNNIAKAAIVVSATATPKPDLLVQRLVLPSHYVAQGANLDFTYSIINGGQATSGPNWAGIYIDDQFSPIAGGWNKIGELGYLGTATSTPVSARQVSASGRIHCG
jgi:predicted Zn-dependent protease